MPTGLRIDILPAAAPWSLLALAAIALASLFLLVRRRRRIEADLRFTRAKFKGMIGIATDAIISINEKHRITDFNAGAEQIFGYAADEVLGRPLAILLPERFRDIHERHIAGFADAPVAARRMGERRDVDIVGRRRDGEQFPAEAAISKIHVEDRWIFTVVLRDITQRRRREEGQRLLATAGSLLSASLDYDATLQSVASVALGHLGDWCAIYLREEDGVVRRVHAAHADPEQRAQLGVLEAHRVIEVPHPARTAIDQGLAVRLDRIDESVRDEMSTSPEHRRAIDALGMASMLAVPLVARGRTVGAIAFYSATAARYGEDDVDLAEELARRAALALDNARLYREARQAITARNEVLSVVSHDLGNPLAAIFIGTRLLLRNLSDEDRERAAWDYLETIRVSAEQMQRLIDDLLEVQRIESGRLSLEWDRHSAATLVKDAVTRIEPIAAEAMIGLEQEVTPDLPPVRGDRERLLQVFGNLLGNAVKFTPAGGRIVVAARVEGTGWVRFLVRDSGPGIPSEQLEHVFDRFWQGKRSSGRRGAGLGLAIARGIVEAHGGVIQASSEIGVGTTLSFTLPAASGTE